jgi:hypothetical protein
MNEKVNTDALHQLWVHSHEEDTDTKMVFRPAGYNFPPSRGRASFNLKADGSFDETGIGADDRRLGAAGTWRLIDKDTLALYEPSQSTPSRTLRIDSVSKDRLIVRK